MADFDIEAIRAQIRAMDFVRGTAAESAMWREDDEDSRANLAIEDMALDPDDAALFDLFRDEAVPPPLATQILLRLLDHPDADGSLPIMPMTVAGVESR
jgi:hypothetical protein